MTARRPLTLARCLLVIVAALAPIAFAVAAADQVFTGSFEACNGQFQGGSCWWFGENNESCNDVCGTHGGYAEATRLLAGSDGDSAACGNLLTAFGAINPLPVTAQASISGISGMGCATDYTDNAVSYRFTSATTAAASSLSNTSLYVRRVCACGAQPAPTSINYAGSPFQVPRNVAMTPALPIVVGYVKTYSVLPALPTGLSINAQTGALSGTPTALQDPAQLYTVTASNAGGTATKQISVRVYAQPPTGLSYSGTPFIFNRNVAISPISPTVTGGVSSYTSDTMPTGLSIHPTTGVLSGTPTTQQGTASYAVFAHNVDGDASTSISIAVQAPLVCGSGGHAVNGTCWYFGENNESCDTVCGTHGGYNAATLTYTGSSGTNAHCEQVMTALGATNPTPASAIATLGGISGMGCGSDYTNDAITYRLTSATTSGASSQSNASLYFRRACSCSN